MSGTVAMAIAFVADLLLGDPARLPHPVVLIGRGIAALEKGIRAIAPKSPAGEFVGGCLLVVILCAATYGVTAYALRLLGLVSPWLAFAGECFLGFQALATKSLAQAAEKVFTPLAHGDVGAARVAVSHIVGRDTTALDAGGIARATVETVAENASDGVVAPLLYFAVGGAPLAMLYKAINTMDSMLGYKNDAYRRFGTAAARLDDVANLVPARLTALLLIGAAWVCGFNWSAAWRLWRRDHARHASPNSAHPESACAGALGISLGGPSVYFGRVVDKPTLGDAVRDIEPEDILRTNHLLYVAAFLALALFVGMRVAFVWCRDGVPAWI